MSDESVKYTQINVKLREDQAEWLKQHPINVSKLIRQMIDKYIQNYARAIDGENND